MPDDKQKGAMSKAEAECWASGGVWVNGACERIKLSTSTIARGVGCDPTEAAIRRLLPSEIAKARSLAMQPLDAPKKTGR